MNSELEKIRQQTKWEIGFVRRGLYISAVIIELPCLLMAQTVQITPSEIATELAQWSNSPSQTLTLTSDSAGGTSRYFWTSVDQPWLSVTPASGTVDRLGKVLTVKYSTANLDPGTYAAQITIVAPSASNSPVVVPVTLTVDPDEISSSAVGMRLVRTPADFAATR